MLKLHELLAKRAKALADWKAIVAKAETETRDLSADETKREGELQAEVADLDSKIARRRALDEAERSAPPIVDARNIGDGTWEARARSFSITTAIRAAIGEPVDAGRERETSAELSRRTGRKFSGIAVPDEAFAPLQQRTVTTGTDGGGALVPNTHLGTQFIERLRPSLILPQLGATILDGLVGDIDIPKQTGSSSAQWVAEDAPLGETDPTFDDLQLSPRTVGSLTSFSRRMLINSVPSIEDLVRRDLAAVIANAVDLAALFGDGTGNQPTGISATPGVHQVSLAAPSWERVLEMIAEVEGSNALGGSLGWALSPWAKRVLRATPKASGEGEGFIMESPTDLAGYRVATSSTLMGNPADSPPSTAAVIFGDFTQLILATWSGTDLLVNPFETEAYKRGRILVRAMRDVDVGIRQPEAFAVASDLPTILVSD